MAAFFIDHFIDGVVMSFPKFVFCSALVLTAGTALAETYSSEVNFGLSETDRDGVDAKIERISLSGEHHLKPVDTHEYPYEEAAFLAKSSYVYGGFDVVNPGQEDNQWLGIAHYIPNSVFYVEGALKRYHDELGEKGNDFGGAAGLRLFDGMLLTTRYWDEQGYKANAYAKIVHQLAGGNFINVEIGYADVDKEEDSVEVVEDAEVVAAVKPRLNTIPKFEAAFDAYFDRTLSVGIRYADYSGADEINLRALKYVTNVFHIGGSINKQEDDKWLAIEAGVRF